MDRYSVFICDKLFNVYTRSVWDLGLNVHHINFMAKRNDA